MGYWIEKFAIYDDIRLLEKYVYSNILFRVNLVARSRDDCEIRYLLFIVLREN